MVAVLCFALWLNEVSLGPGPAAAEAPNGDFSVGPEQLAVLVKDRNVEALEQYGGVSFYF